MIVDDGETVVCGAGIKSREAFGSGNCIVGDIHLRNVVNYKGGAAVPQ